MAKQVSTSNFMDRLRKAHAEVAANPVDMGGGSDLPAGIEGGVAQLTDVHIGTFQSGANKGKPFFYAAGVVVAPESFTVTDPASKKSYAVRIKGMRTQLRTEPICDTQSDYEKARKSMKEHWNWVLNELKKLGLENAENIDPNEIVVQLAEDKFESGPVLEAMLAPDNPIFFRFRTWKGTPTETFPNPTVQHEWRGKCEYSAEEAGESAVEDETGGKPGWEKDEEFEAEAEEETEAEAEQEEEADELAQLGEAADAKDKDAQKQLQARAKKLKIDPDKLDKWVDVANAIREAEVPEEAEEEAETEAEEEGEADYETSWRDLGEDADEGDQDAADKLSEIAAEYDIDPNDFGPWVDLVDALAKARAEKAKEEAAAEPEPPSEGDNFMYKPKGAKRAIECTVVGVFKKAQTVNLKNLDDGKTIYKQVPFADLEEVSPF